MMTGSFLTGREPQRVTLASTSADSLFSPGEQRFLLRGADWQTYQAISEALRGRHVRLTYDRGNLEFMTISHAHGNLSRLLARLVVVLTEEFQLPVRSCGDMTCEKQDLDRGLEPDECFYLAHEPQIRGRDEIDLAVDPPPDLAIEIDISRSSRNRLPIYAAMGVPEVWRFDGTTLTFYRLQGNGSYAAAEASGCFPAIAPGVVSEYLLHRHEQDENALVRSFRERVRTLKSS